MFQSMISLWNSQQTCSLCVLCNVAVGCFSLRSSLPRSIFKIETTPQRLGVRYRDWPYTRSMPTKLHSSRLSAGSCIFGIRCGRDGRKSCSDAHLPLIPHLPLVPRQLHLVACAPGKLSFLS